MITLEKDSHRQLAVMRARECIRKAKRPIPESRIDIHTVRKAADRTIQKWGYRRLLMKYGAITLIALTMTVINWRKHDTSGRDSGEYIPLVEHYRP